MKTIPKPEAKLDKRIPDKRTFGYKNKDPIIPHLKRWHTCSFCGRPSEVLPQAPLDSKEWLQWKFPPMRLCYYCASVQDNIRQMIQSILNRDGN